MTPDALPDTAAVVLVAGKKSYGKGTPYLLGAAHRVVAQVPEALFVLLGKGTESVTLTRPWLWNLPPVPHEEMPAWYDAARVVCQPSVSPDAAPRSLIEAAAAGRALVGTRVGGIPELIEDGVTGFLVPPRDPVALAAALVRALDLDTAIRLGTAAWTRTGRA